MFDRLTALLERVPTVEGDVASGQFDGGGWYVKFRLESTTTSRGTSFRNSRTC